MTTNQIAYWNLQESKRSNQAQESLKSEELSERSRSNRAVESETRRHNRATEEHAYRKLASDEKIAANKNLVDITGKVISGTSTIASKLLS